MNRQNATDYIIDQINSPDFVNRHKSNDEDFTRSRTLSFKILFIILLRKSIKSLQLVLNEMFMDKNIKNSITASAYSQARKKLSYTAFQELSNGIVSMQYQDYSRLKLWHGFRLLGVDASKIILPNHLKIAEEFGATKIKNQTAEGSYNCAIFECCYDVLNHLVIEGVLEKSSVCERDLALKILKFTKEDDVLIYDRGYCSYKFPAILLQQKKNFVIRCQRSCFKAADEFFSGKFTDKIVTIKIPKNHHREFQSLGLELEFSVRFVSVILSTGEIEVLMTSLTAPKITQNDFKELYGFRWQIETFFGILKSRLSLENFTGLSVESIKQDFWSTILISNYETILTFDTNQELSSNKSVIKHELKVNKAVAFNIIKHQAFNILFCNDPEGSESKIQKLHALFKTAAVPIRSGRSAIRKKPSGIRSYNFLLRKKKHIF